MFSPPRFSAPLRIASVIFSCSLLAGCAARPGPAPIEAAEATPTAAPVTTTYVTPMNRPEIQVGVDGPRNGFNPHLMADASAFIDSLASLVLPSAFHWDAEQQQWLIDADLLTFAEPIAPRPGQAQTIRYEIAPAAQWSDGTPVTGNDFQYLWRSMLATPAVVDRAGYEMVSAIRVSGGGKSVEVDFSQPYQYWQSLFTNLLPAHLLQGRNFSEALKDGIPASAGRYALSGVDRARGVVRLARNDRFWGPDPAVTELLTLRTVKRAVEGTDQLRSGQIAYADVTPEGTAIEAYGLLPKTQSRVLETGRQLVLTASVNSPLLGQVEQRQQFFSTLNLAQIARIANSREHPISVPALPSYLHAGADPVALKNLDRPLVIAADPADPTAATAARVIIDQLNAHGVEARMLATDLGTAAATGLPQGAIDAVVSWSWANPDPVNLASIYGCEIREVQGRGSNLSGLCTQRVERELLSGLSGATDPADLREAMNKVEAREVLRLPLLNEQRLLVLGPNLQTGESRELASWNAGLSTAATWRKIDDTTEKQPPSPEPDPAQPQ